MAVLDNIQDILSALFSPAFKIFFLRVGDQINKTAFAATQTGKRFNHKLFPPIKSKKFYVRRILK
jgi:hypothetical protein